MNVRRHTIALAAVAIGVGCGSDDPVSPEDVTNDGGIGNSLLHVEAEVDVEQTIGGFITEFDVDVADANEDPVSGAVVVIEGGFGKVTLAETGSQGHYAAELPGAAWGTLRLSVERDAMFVSDVVLRNIGIHTILEPAENDTVAADAPLVLRWYRDSPAQSVRLFTHDVELKDISDTGEFTLAADKNPARSSQMFFIERLNEVAIAGGLPGSYFQMEVEYTIEPVRVE